MKKIIAVITGCVCFFYLAKAQVASSDAVKLKEIFTSTITPQSYQDANAILAKYLPPSTTDTTADQVRLAYLTNPFINSVTIPVSANYFSFAGQNSSLALGNAISDLGNIDVTSFADGLAKFLIKRSKQELLISFFSNLQDTSKYPEFRILFPNTKILVDNFNSWEYSNIINTLKEAFNKDIKQIMSSIRNVADLDETDTHYNKAAQKRIRAIKTFFGTDKGRLFLSALLIGDGFTTNKKIPDIIHNITDVNHLAGLPGITTDEKNIIRLLDILSYGIRSNAFEKHYISVAEFNALMADAITSKIYLGLLYQQLKSETIVVKGVDVADLIKNAAGLTSGIKSFINTIGSGATTLTDAISKLSEAKKKGETDLSQYWGIVFENANSFFQSIGDLQTIHPAFTFPNQLRKTLNQSMNTLEIAHDIAVKNYNAVITGLLTLISQNLNTSNEIADFKLFFVKYGSLAANIVEAKNSDDAEKAIEAAALPVGSASIKKKTVFNIALNAYLGGFYGKEYLAEKKEDKTKSISGVYAPVGITFSWGLNNKGTNCKVLDFFTKGASISGLINVIDIGAIASFRLQDSKTEKLPEVKLQNILAPGLGIIYGLPKWPVSLGYSYQFGPALREINAADKIVSDQLNHRWQFFLAVDIPLLNFYTKSK